MTQVLPQIDQHQIYLGMGTNRGNRISNLTVSIDALPPKVRVVRKSPIYQTPPWGYIDQPDFLNLVVEATTSLPPAELLSYLKMIEKEVGRTASFEWGPREIDIDILFYDQLILDENGLVIPHPRLHERAFILVPLADLISEFVHPLLKKNVLEMLAELDREEIIRYK